MQKKYLFIFLSLFLYPSLFLFLLIFLPNFHHIAHANEEKATKPRSESSPSPISLHHVKLEKLRNKSDSLELKFYQVRNTDRPLSTYVEEFPLRVVEHEPISSRWMIEVTSTNEEDFYRQLENLGLENPRSRLFEFTANQKGKFLRRSRLEVRTLVDNGPSENRIDLVFMGDGYTEAEKEKFDQDMQRLIDDLFRSKTFSSYLPIFNVHTVFEPSNDSGIGRRYPKDTAYELYRSGNTLRAIFPGNERNIRDACYSAPGCDYPIVIANDDFYGGLGGEFAISTRSRTSGSLVLRHELGHNFGKVGEEYDGGSVFGANSSRNLRSLSWKHWLTSPETLTQPAKALFLDWPWKNLAEGDFVAEFYSPGNMASAEIKMSVSGIETAQTLDITLDDRRLEYESPNQADRTFVTTKFEEGFTKGRHEVVFSENVKDGNNWVSSLAIYEYGENYDFSEDTIGAYPVFSRSKRVIGYRPTHDVCLMRDMNSERFCVVCQENNWAKFFGRIQLIDEVTVVPTERGVTVSVHVLPLGQKRTFQSSVADYYEVRWFQNGVRVAELDDQFEVTLASGQGVKVQVSYFNSEIRKPLKTLQQTISL